MAPRLQALRAMFGCRAVLVVAAMTACGDNAKAPAADASSDAGASRSALGRHLVTHDAIVQGLTSDGYLIYTDVAGGTPVAHAVPLAGGDDVVIATSASTARDDFRVAVADTLVFAWSNRGNRSATLTLWSAATGPQLRTQAARPGRAAASNGRILYERNATATSAEVVSGLVDGTDVVIDTANAADGTCWRSTDLVTVAGHQLARYCPAGATTWTLRSIASNGSMLDLSQHADQASYGDSHVVWLETGGVLAASHDGATSHTLATDAASAVATNDASQVAYLSTSGAVRAGPSDGALATLEASGAVALGALSPDGTHALYATQLRTGTHDDVAPYTDVRVASPAAGATLVRGTTSCPGCLFDSFTADDSYALVLDPIDNSQAADEAGPIAVHDVSDGHTITTFGENIYTAVRLDGAGQTTRFVFVDAVRDSTLATGWAYGLSVRSLRATADTPIARAAESFWIETERGVIVSSFGGTDDVAGIWVYTTDGARGRTHGASRGVGPRIPPE
jgi:hypothetical protein